MSTSLYTTHSKLFRQLLFASYCACFKCKKSNNTEEYKKNFVDFVKIILINITPTNVKDKLFSLKLDPTYQQLDLFVPKIFFSKIPKIIKTWSNRSDFMKDSNNNGTSEYINSSILQKASEFINEKFISRPKVNILDIGSGNGHSAKRLLSFLDDKFSIMCTDPLGDVHKTSSSDKLIYKSESINCLNAVETFGRFINDVILIMSPIPSSIQKNGFPSSVGGGFDLITIEYMIKQNIKNPIIIIGECGAGDSIYGMHNYLINNDKLNIEYHVISNIIEHIQYPMISTKIPSRIAKYIYFVDII